MTNTIEKGENPLIVIQIQYTSFDFYSHHNILCDQIGRRGPLAIGWD